MAGLGADWFTAANQARRVQGSLDWLSVEGTWPGFTDAKTMLQPGSQDTENLLVSPEPG